ncbi:MAG TPA: biotin--[acetyl-CoA-carboxylase] ligase [Bacillota bacterium]|nr:biotin--[acetyl-CoA-carboxylase] ligase [Bacillota bacterium]
MKVKPSFDILQVEETDSTNRMARVLAESGACDGTVVVAGRQTAGRGRRGRSWLSSGDFGLWFSVVLRPEFEPNLAGLLGIGAAVAVARAVDKLTGVSADLKWPNDVLIGGRKVCGVLAEASTAAGRVEWAVVGVGINLFHPEGGFPPEISPVATSLSEHMGPEAAIDRERLLGAVLDELADRLALLEREGARGACELVDEAERLMRSMMGRRITVKAASGQFEAVAVRLDHEGGLVVANDCGESIRVTSADVSIGYGPAESAESAQSAEPAEPAEEAPAR